MSCFVMNEGSLSSLAYTLGWLMNEYSSVYHGFSSDFKAEFKTVVFNKVVRDEGHSVAYAEKHYEEEIYKLLYSLNLKAYNARYKEEGEFIPDFVKSAPRFTNNFQIVKTMQCWLYQCDETDDVTESDFYKIIETVVNIYMKYVFMHLPQYESAVWG